ncbi:MAG: FAD-binding protein [Anaeroplasmataceae bacterium]|nr:FAD-binding protein [Anaeroplasmataceae bacterium]
MKEIKQFDVVILGGGLAGIYAALTLDSNLHIGLFIKDSIERGSSNLAQGGIAAEVIWDEAKIEEHYEDTLRAGGYLNDKEATRILVEEAGKHINQLLSLGVHFDKNSDGWGIQVDVKAWNNQELFESLGFQVSTPQKRGIPMHICLSNQIELTDAMFQQCDYSTRKINK